MRMGLTQRRKGAKGEWASTLLFLCAFAPLRGILLGALLTTLGVSAVRAAEKPPAAGEIVDETARYRVETLLAGLDQPTSVALRPGSENLGAAELFVSESGAGRVLRLTVDDPSKSRPVVSGFPIAESSDLPATRVGPLGLAFLSRNRLAVGTGGLGPGADVVRVYNVSDAAAELAYDASDHAAGPVPASDRSADGEGAYWSLAASERAMFVVPRRGDAQGWVLKATLDANRIADLAPMVAVRDLAGAPAPGAVAVDPRPQLHYLVVGTRGAATAEPDARITMVSPLSGALALNMNTGLRDIAALAYSPAPSFDLYAADDSQAEPAAGGVYRIEAVQVDGRSSCRAVKIASAARPTSIAFTSDGAMFVTALGEPAAGDAAAPAGVLLKITPQADVPRL
jgi:hypothetical protein